MLFKYNTKSNKFGLYSDISHLIPKPQVTSTTKYAHSECMSILFKKIVKRNMHFEIHAHVFIKLKSLILV